MQFGYILAFATLVVASPTPVILENRAGSPLPSISLPSSTPSLLPSVQFSTPLSQYITDLAKNISTAVSANAANARSLIGVAAGTSESVLQSYRDTTIAAIRAIIKAVKPFEFATLTGITTTAGVGSAAALAGATILQSDLASIISAFNTLNTTLTNSDLQSILALTVTAGVTGINDTVTQEVKNINAILSPLISAASSLVTPLNNVQAAVGAAASIDPTAFSTLANGFGAFVTSIAALLVTLKSN